MDTYIKIGPKDFINGPYTDCPKCGKNAFGVLMICDNHYCRRCRECLYPRGHEQAAAYPLPRLNKVIIYLDQFAISNMMLVLNPDAKAYQKGKVDPFWKTLFEKIDSLCKLQLIICPDSDFHRHESMLSRFYEPLKRMYELLSHGVSFYDDDTIHRFQITEQLHRWLGDQNVKGVGVQDLVHGNINAWQERIIFSVGDFRIPGLVDEIRKTRETIADNLKPIFQRWQTETEKNFNYWYKEEKKANAKVLWERYARILQSFTSASFGIGAFNPWDATDFANVTIHQILETFKERGIEKNDLFTKLAEFLCSEAFENTPYIRISAMLWASLARKAASGRKNPPNRGFETDVKIVSTLLPYCDAMFIDNEFRAYLAESPVSKTLGYSTKIYSYKTRESFLAYLDEISSKASPGHFEKIREVYGDDWDKPFSELYEHRG